MAREKYSVAGRFSRPPLENLKDGCVTTMKKEKSPPEVKRPQTGRECNNKGTDCSALDVTVLFQVVHEMLRRVVLTVTPCSSLYRPEKFTMYSPSVHPLSNQLPSRRTRTNSEGPEAAILPPSAKIPDLVFFIIGISNVSKASLTGYHPG